MYYRHALNYQYPERCDQHMIEVKRTKDVTFDEDYPYMPHSIGYKLVRVLYWLGVTLIVFPLLHLTHGLRIYGKENLKKNKQILKDGAITVSNHVFYWDYLCVLKAMRPRLAYFPAWKMNFEGSGGSWIRASGGIPVPTDNMHAMIKFNRAMEEVLESGKWLHFFPEGSMWLYYPDIRPLKKAVFHYAVKYDKPVIPITLSFRPRKGITKLFTKKPMVDLHIGEPIFADQSLSRVEAERKMHEVTYHVMQEMNGIGKDAPTHNEDQNPTHYQKTM